MKNGEIAEVGTHNSLLDDYPEGVYAELIKKQQFVEDDKDEEDLDESVSLNDITLVRRKSTKNLNLQNEVEAKTKMADEEHQKWVDKYEETLKNTKKRGVF